MDQQSAASAWQTKLACPVCRGVLVHASDGLVCTNAVCGCRFPTVDGVPILINESNSVFSTDDFLEKRQTTFTELKPASGNRRPGLLRRIIPSNSRSVSRGNDERFCRDYTDPDQVVLVIGAGDKGYSSDGGANLVYSDVHLGEGVDLIADGHDLPFQDASIDAVLAVAVMEHVADPQRCAAEVARILKPGGRVYAATPFMQQVHMGRYDFTRFTHLGHRRLWRRFREVESGIACGPGMALAWAWQYFLLSFSENQTTRKYLRAFAKLTSFPLPYLDEFLKHKRGAYDAASAFYFIGEKADTTRTDRQLISEYRGLDSP